MAQRTWTLSRGQMLRAMPKHLLWAAISGAVVGMLLCLVTFVPLPDWMLAIIAGALWSNAAVVPVAVPGRHWSFAFIGAMMLFLLLVAGTILAQKLPFPHAPDYVWRMGSEILNLVSWLAVLTGGCIGLLYGLLVGKRSSMVVGLALGTAIGFLLGLGFEGAVTLEGWELGASVHGRFDGPLHFAWQGALAMVVLHAAAGLGAALGAGAAAPVNPQSKIENQESC